MRQPVKIRKYIFRRPNGLFSAFPVEYKTNRMPATEPNDWSPCPHCGFDLPPNARVCRECGFSDDYVDSGDSYDPHDDDFDYDDFVARAFPQHGEADSPASGRQMWIRMIILAIIGSFVLSLLLT
jgi:hypothetical protein